MQVLLNLLGNAIKFTDSGEVALKISVSNGVFLVSVTDTGPGIEQSDQDRIFDEFHQSETARVSRKGGSGLGLPISKRFIELQGGQIGVKSTPGQGSTFWFTLPIRAEDSRRSEMTGRILVVEDHEDNRRILRDLLTSVGFQLIEAETGPDGVQMAKLHQPDLILMDLQLPGIDGYEAARQIKAEPHLSSVPIIAVTSFALSGDEERAFAAGCSAYISKPYSPRQLLARIREHLPASAS